MRYTQAQMHPGQEVRVTSWIELMSELHSRNLVQLRPQEGGHLRSPYVFRGMGVAKWDLETSLQRLSGSPSTKTKVEQALLRSFRKYANGGAFDKHSEWYLLAVAQHNGLPTRCLDWTASPLVAAHFACSEEAHKSDDGVIWCIHAGILRDINSVSLKGIAWVYDTRLLENRFSDLTALDSSHALGEVLLLWEPPSLDQRIASQWGLLSLMNSGQSLHTDFLQTHSPQYPDLVVRIIISSAMKSEARDMLDQNNISERSLFPGLPGLCTWLRRYYGTSW
jgi:hypothetical protein